MVCPDCGADNISGTASFCPSCGLEFPKEAPRGALNPDRAEGAGLTAQQLVWGDIRGGGNLGHLAYPMGWTVRADGGYALAVLGIDRMVRVVGLSVARAELASGVLASVTPELDRMVELGSRERVASILLRRRDLVVLSRSGDARRLQVHDWDAPGTPATELRDRFAGQEPVAAALDQSGKLAVATRIAGGLRIWTEARHLHFSPITDLDLPLDDPSGPVSLMVTERQSGMRHICVLAPSGLVIADSDGLAHHVIKPPQDELFEVPPGGDWPVVRPLRSSAPLVIPSSAHGSGGSITVVRPSEASIVAVAPHPAWLDGSAVTCSSDFGCLVRARKSCHLIDLTGRELTIWDGQFPLQTFESMVVLESAKGPGVIGLAGDQVWFEQWAETRGVQRQGNEVRVTLQAGGAGQIQPLPGMPALGVSATADGEAVHSFSYLATDSEGPIGWKVLRLAAVAA
jgi:hypothetical protein